METDSRLLKFAAKKRQFDDDGPQRKQEATLVADGQVLLSFWVSAHRYPDNVLVSLDEFIGKPVDELPHWERNELGDWHIGPCGRFTACG